MRKRQAAETGFSLQAGEFIAYAILPCIGMGMKTYVEWGCRKAQTSSLPLPNHLNLRPSQLVPPFGSITAHPSCSNAQPP